MTPPPPPPPPPPFAALGDLPPLPEHLPFLPSEDFSHVEQVAAFHMTCICDIPTPAVPLIAINNHHDDDDDDDEEYAEDDDYDEEDDDDDEDDNCIYEYVDAGLSEGLIERRLKVVREKPTTSDGNPKFCVICQEDLYQEDRAVGLLDCRHEFHADCIGTWLQKKNRCPICRKIAIDY